MKKTIAVMASLCALGMAAALLYSQPQPGASHVTVDVSQRFQSIDGFGVNFNGTYFRDSQKPMIDMLNDTWVRPSSGWILTDSRTGRLQTTTRIRST